MKKGFDLKRVISFAQYMVGNEPKKFVYLPAVTLLATFLANIGVDGILYMSYPNGVPEVAFLQSRNTMTIFEFVFFAFIVQYQPTSISDFLGKKGLFSRYIMLPISSSERFVTLSVFNYIATPLTYAVCIVLGVLLALLPEMAVFSFGMNNYWDSVTMGLPDFWPISALIAFGISVFFLGSMFWHKRAFVKTFALCAVVQTTLFFILLIAAENGWFHKINSVSKDEVQLVFTIGLYAMAVVFTALSWIVYKKRTVISRSY